MNSTFKAGINQRMNVRTTTSGKKIVEGTIRVRNKMKNEEGKYDSSFLNYKVLPPRSELFLQTQAEGAFLAISGWDKQERWEKDGQKHSKNVIMVDDFHLPPREQTEDNKAANGWKQSQDNKQFAADPFATGGKIDLHDDDLPF